MTDTKQDYNNNKSFYEMYADYLVEPGVRAVHDPILAAVKLHPSLQRVVDIGCGQGNEFFTYGNKPEFYYGIDQNALENNENGRITTKGDYRDPEVVKQIVDAHDIKGITSLYSAELTKPRDENHAYYEKLFADNPNVNVIYVSGIYYKAHKNEELVPETGDIMSYQTMPEIGNRPNTEAFIETRVEIPCPSNMFHDCIEVHRLLQRTGSYHHKSAAALSALAPEGCVVENRMPLGFGSALVAAKIQRDPSFSRVA